jgi:hypothetical protein
MQWKKITQVKRDIYNVLETENSRVTVNELL